MDEPKLPISLPEPDGPVGAEAAPAIGDDRHLAVSDQETAASDRDHVEPPADPPRENSHVVYCENEEELSEGFAIALHIMGLKQSL